MAGPGQSPGTAATAAGAGIALSGAVRAVIMRGDPSVRDGVLPYSHRAGHGTGIESSNRLVSPQLVPGTNWLPPGPGPAGSAF